MRTVPEDDHQVRAITQILNDNHWTWVGVVTTDGDYGRYAVERLQHHATKSGICLAFTSALPELLNDDSYNESIDSTVKSIINNKNVRVIVSFAKANHMMCIFDKLLKDPQGRGKVWLASDNWSQSSEVLNTTNYHLNDVGTIFGITFKSGNPTRFEQYLNDLDENPNHHENNTFLFKFLKEHELKSSEELKKMIYPYAVFSIELAVKAIAQAVKDLCTGRDCKTKQPDPVEVKACTNTCVQCFLLILKYINTQTWWKPKVD